MAEELSEQQKKQLAEGQAALAKAHEQYAARTKGKPTPTQQENDEAAVGKHFVEHEADGGDLDPNVERAMEAKPGAGYQTRQARPAAPTRSTTSA